MLYVLKSYSLIFANQNTTKRRFLRNFVLITWIWTSLTRCGRRETERERGIALLNCSRCIASDTYSTMVRDHGDHVCRVQEIMGKWPIAILTEPGD
jgi:hypothetical protein